jgi:alkylhydroperoxidase/carboxymuconolactone decarboxylase family protein YurZ
VTVSFIQSVRPEDAGDELKEIYEQDLKSQGYIANYTKTMSLRPKAIEAWRALSRTVRSTMRLRRYELITLAAAVALRCTY